MKRAQISIAAALMSCLVAQPAAALSYSALPFSGRVVDADTKQPLEGVIVVASWELEGRMGLGVGALYSTEGVTDRDGRYSMRRWGPVEVTRHAGGESLPARMSPNEPTLFLFKAGYEPGREGLFNPGQGAGHRYYDTSFLNDPYWTGDLVRVIPNDLTVELRRWTKSDAEFNRRLVFWDRAFLNGCGWARAPRMTAALIREGDRLKDFNPTKRNEVLNPEWLMEDFKGQHCGSKKAILDEALK